MPRIEEYTLDQFLISADQENTFPLLKYKENEVHHRIIKKRAFKLADDGTTKILLHGNAGVHCMEQLLGVPVFIPKDKVTAQPEGTIALPERTLAMDMVLIVMDRFLKDELPQEVSDHIFKEFTIWSSKFVTVKRAQVEAKEVMQKVSNVDGLKALGTEMLNRIGQYYVEFYSKTFTSIFIPAVMVGGCNIYGFQMGSLPNQAEDGGAAIRKYDAVAAVFDAYQKYHFDKTDKGRTCTKGTADYNKNYGQWLMIKNSGNNKWSRARKQAVMYQMDTLATLGGDSEIPDKDTGKIYRRKGIYDCSTTTKTTKIKDGLNLPGTNVNPEFADVVLTYTNGKDHAEMGKNMGVVSYTGETNVTADEWFDFDEQIENDIYYKKIRQFVDFDVDAHIEEASRFLNSDPDKGWLTADVQRTCALGLQLLNIGTSNVSSEDIIKQATEQYAQQQQAQSGIGIGAQTAAPTQPTQPAQPGQPASPTQPASPSEPAQPGTMSIM